MFTAIPKKYHIESLKIVAEKIKDLEYVIFYGTLLGVTREGDILERDDDVDILINLKDRDKCLEALKNSELDINLQEWPNHSPYFLQARRVYDEKYLSCVDFYLYDDTLLEDHIVDRWNFSGQFNNSDNHIHIPNDIIFPIRQTKLKDFYINVPANSIKCCEYLYGKKWMFPFNKFHDYETVIVRNKPHVMIKSYE
jgi:hypothetical protein